MLRPVSIERQVAALGFDCRNRDKRLLKRAGSTIMRQQRREESNDLFHTLPT